ncbi:MAG: CRISPR-associated endonuclease Cas1 [Cryomorphaceae bacterium]|nr:CRISPR-associated endonuclease Cas1 [Cryomorphaceae bacterium]
MQILIDTFGTSLHRKENAFEVWKKGETQKIAPTKIKSIVLSKGAKISSDAILLAIENEIDVVFVDRGGTPKGRVWSHKYGSISTIRKNQVLFAKSKEGADWVKGIIKRKALAQIELLQSLHRDRPKKQDVIKSAIERMNGFTLRIEALELYPIESNSDMLRAFEGNISKNYFQTLAAVVPKIYYFDHRSKRPAKDMFNCVLNYLYGCLYQRVEASLITAGIDPYLGIFHRDEYNRPVLVFDVIEKYRVWADAVAMQLCFRRLLLNEMFSKNSNGGYWLEYPGKKVVVQAFNDYLDEVVQMNVKRRTRLTHIQDESHQFASTLLEYTE